MLLGATTDTIEVLLSGAKTTNDCPVHTSYVDKTTTPDLVPGKTVINTNGVTAVTVVPAFSAPSTQRQVKTFNLYNADTAAKTFTVRFNANATTFSLITVTLQVGDTLFWSKEEGWEVMDANGRNKTSTGASMRTRQILTAASGTYSTPPGCTAILVRALGGGGAGGGAATAATSGAAGAGGTSGNYVEKFISGPASTYAYACGTGGTAGTAGNNPGNAGVDTTFGAVLTAKGGSGGSGSAAGTLLSIAGPGAAGGGVGDIVVLGPLGGSGLVLSAAIVLTGAGASSCFGFGGQSKTGAGAGNNAGGFGSGGGGGAVVSASAAVSGGTGSAGLIIVEEFY